jgi:hypothetical protein
LRLLNEFSRLCPLVCHWPLSLNLPVNIWLRPHIYRFDLNLNLDRCAWQKIVLDGIVSRWATELPSLIICLPGVRCNTNLLGDIHRFRQLLNCPYCYGGSQLGGHPFGQFTLVYL